jgi:hypothetical protein
MSEERYSDKRLAESFSVYLLFSESLTVMPGEILEAVKEDYPSLDWSDVDGFPVPLEVGKVGLGTWTRTLAEGQRSSTSFISTPGRMEIDWSQIFDNSKMVFPNARDVVNWHQTSLMVSVSSVDTSVAARFDAARRATCIAAVFAKLDVCVAVYFPSSDLIIRPDDWVTSAATAVAGQVPFLRWINIYALPFPDEKNIAGWNVGTIGLAAFTGRELLFPQTPVSPAELASFAATCITMMIEYGSQYKDGDTAGVEDSDLIYRIRVVEEGKHGYQTDTCVFLHPDSYVDEMATYGPRAGIAPPKGMQPIIRGQQGFLGRALGRLRGGPKQ